MWQDREMQVMQARLPHAVHDQSASPLARYYSHVSVAGTTITSMQLHGPNAESAVPRIAPHLSSQTRGWVRTLLNSGQTVQQIMRKHCQRIKAAMDAGVGLGRDAALMQDVRSNIKKTYLFTWSVCSWTSHRSQVRSLCWAFRQTPCRPHAIQYGHDNVVPMDATFGTNRMKYETSWQFASKS